MDVVASVAPESPPFPRMQGVGEDGFVHIDVPCRKCGYDLRALSADARCPECGTEVLFSLRSEQLCDADPVWVNQLATGARLIAWSLVAQFVVGCVVQPFRSRGIEARTLLEVAALAPWLIGIWLLTRPDPSARGEREYGRVRQTWFLAAIALVLFDVLYALSSRSIDRWAWGNGIAAARAVISMAVAIIGLRYIARLCARMTNRSLAMQARVLAISFACCYAAFALSLSFPRGVFRFLPQQVVTCVSALVLLVFAISEIAYLSLLARLADRLRSQARLSEALLKK